jgi:hypothetical protein
LTISLIAGFCTILWPYAYIGLETKQSLFLLVAAFVAMEHRRPESWLAATTFAVSSAFAIGAKSTGTFLLPVFGFLVWEYSRRVRLAHVSAGRSRGLVALAAFVPIAGFLANSYARSFFWRDWGGSASFIQFWLVTDPLTPALNVAAFLGSPNKGLWVFSPICLVACYAIPRAWTTRPRLVLFAVLTLAGLAGGFSLLRNWADETWGPRYLHASICPLLLALVAAYPRPGTGTRTVLGVAAALGLAAAVLGVLFPYGALPAAATMTGQNTLEGYQGDIGLNHLRFNAQLLGAWRHPEQSHAWGAKKQWFYEAPADALPPKSVDLRVFSTPQPVLVRHLFTPKPGIIGWVWGGYLACLLAGLVLLAVAALRMRSVPDG